MLITEFGSGLYDYKTYDGMTIATRLVHWENAYDGILVTELPMEAFLKAVSSAKKVMTQSSLTILKKIVNIAYFEMNIDRYRKPT